MTQIKPDSTHNKSTYTRTEAIEAIRNTMLYDLKMPLSIVSGYADLIQHYLDLDAEEIADSERLLRYVQDSNIAIDSIQHLIDHITTIAQNIEGDED